VLPILDSLASSNKLKHMHDSKQTLRDRSNRPSLPQQDFVFPENKVLQLIWILTGLGRRY
jgi:hypothetical protein